MLKKGDNDKKGRSGSRKSSQKKPPKKEEQDSFEQVKKLNKELKAENEILNTISEKIQEKHSELEETLQRLNEFRSLFQHMNEGVAVFKMIKDESRGARDYVLIDVNDAFRTITGFKNRKLTGKKLSGLDFMNDSRNMAVFEKVVDTGEPRSFETFSRKLNLHLFMSVFLLRQEQFVVVLKDISSRKEAERKIEESRSRLNEIINHSSDLHYIHDTENKLIFVSPQSETILGYSPDEMNFKWTKLLTDDPMNSRGVEFTRKAIETGEKQPVYTLELTRKDRKCIWVQVDESPLKDEAGKVTGIVGALRDITAEKTAMTRLTETNERLKLAMEAANEGKWEYHQETDSFLLDEKISLLFGYDPDPAEHPGSWIAGLIHPDQRDEVISEFEEYRNGKREFFNKEYQIKHYYGHYLWVSCHAKIIKLPVSEGRIMVGMLRDITRRKQNELALAESERRIRFINDTVNDILWQMDKNMVFTYVSPSAKRIMGYAPDEMTGKSVTEYLTAESRQLLFEMLKRKISEPAVSRHDYVEYEMIGKNRKRVFVEVSSNPVFNENGELIGLSGVSRDITTRKKVERALMESEERYRRLVMNMNELICEIDEHGRFTFVNDLYDQVLGYKPDELIGKPVAEFLHPDDRQPSADTYDSLLKKHGSSSNVWRFCDNRGDYHFFECKATTYKNNLNKIRTVVVSSDITDRVKAETELMNSRNSLLRAEEVAGFGHWEINFKTNEVKGSEGAKRIYGLEGDSLSYDIIKTLPLPEYRPMMDQAMKDLIHDRKKYDIEFRIKRKDNGEIADIHSVAEFDPETQTVFGIINDITRRKNVERGLRESEERFRGIVENNAVPMIIIDNEKDSIHFNSKFTEIFGYRVEDLSGVSSWWEMAFPDEKLREDAKEKWLRATGKARKNDGDIDRQIFTIICKDGEERIVDFNLVSLGAMNIISMFDITEIKRAEAEVQESKAILQTAMDQSQTGIAIADAPDGKLRYVNLAGMRIMGEEQMPQIGSVTFNEYSTTWNLFDLEGNRLKDDDLPLIQALKDGKNSSEDIVIINSKGEDRIVMVNAAPIRDAEGNIKSAIAVFIDVTESRKAEKRRIENEEKLRLTIQASRQGLYDVNLKKETVSVSPEYAEMLGYNKEDFETDVDKWQKSLHPDDRERVVNYLDRYLNGELEEYKTEFRLKTASGDWCWILSQGKIVEYDNKGKPVRMLGTHSDISQIKEYELELERKNQEIASQNEEYVAINEELQSTLEEIRETNIKLEEAKEKAEESDRLKSAFLANMSHEIRTPMNSILGFSDLMTQRDLTAEKREKFSRLINHSGEQLMRLINDIIDISKIESNQLEIDLGWCNVNNLISEIVEMQSHSKQLKSNKDLNLVLRTLPDEDPVIFTDPQRLTQILDNLLNNAIKFTMKGTIEIGYVPMDKNGERMIRFFVKDTGIGIPHKSQGEIFKRFVQADNQDYKSGTGLGLSITKGLVELLGGHIWLESESGKGTSFFFTLPYHKNTDKRGMREKQTFNGKLPDLGGKTIYIAEDDPGSYIYLLEILEESGVSLTHLKNGQELIKEINKKKPDLILLDINMPVIDGIEAARIIRKNYPEIPIIAQTAYAMADEKEACYEAGCNAYVSKPIKRDILISRISELIG